MKPRRRWRASERIALSVLEERGYRVLERNKKIVVNGVELSEVDAIVVDKSGEKYAVEIKAGRVDVGGIRQAVVNAQLLGLKPLIVAKGFADDAARELAKFLGVKTILLEDVFLVDSEELALLIESVFRQVLEKYLTLLILLDKDITEKYYNELKVIALSENIVDASQKLRKDIHMLAETIKKIKEELGIPLTYSDIRLLSLLFLLRESIIRDISNKLVGIDDAGNKHCGEKENKGYNKGEGMEATRGEERSQIP